MKLTECIPANKVAIIGLEDFEYMKELAQANEQKIEQLALQKLNEEMKVKGIYISVEISGVKEIIRHRATIQEIGEFAIYRSDYPLPEQIRHHIVDAIVKEANDKLREERDNIEKTFYEIYEVREKKHLERTKVFMHCAFTFLIATIFFCVLWLMK